MARAAKADVGSLKGNLVLGTIFIIIGLLSGSERFMIYGVLGGIIVIGRALLKAKEKASGVVKVPLTDFGYETSKSTSSAAFHLAEKGLRHKGAVPLIKKTLFIFATYLPLDQTEKLNEFPVNDFMTSIEGIMNNFNGNTPKIEVQATFQQPGQGKDKTKQVIPLAIVVNIGMKTKKQDREQLEISLTDEFRRIDNEWLVNLGFPTPELTYAYDKDLKIVNEAADKYFMTWSSRLNN